MSKTWIVFRHEYLRHVKRKGFILGLLSIPIFLVVSMGISIVAALLSEDMRPVGYVDLSGLFADAQPLPPQNTGWLDRDVEMRPFENEAAARHALEAGEIQAYYVIAADYLRTGNVRLVTSHTVEADIHRQFSKFLLTHLLKDEDPTVRDRVLEGPNLTLRTLTSDQKIGSRNFFSLLVALFCGVIFVIAISTSGGYLLQAVVEEKENRTIEVILTSISTDSLMIGKVLGNLCVGLTQLLFWLLMGGLAALFALRAFPDFQGMEINASFFGLVALTFLPGFVMIAALMTTVGATATESREAQQIAGLFTLPAIVPFWFMGAIIEHPNSPLAIGFSLFPFTAPMTLPLRAMVTNLPVWQIVLSVAVLWVAAAAAIWLASRAFRLGMLLYGKRLTLAQILRSR